MTWEMAIVFIVIFIMGLGLLMEWARPDLIVFFSLAFLILIGVVEPQDALKGFSNEGMLTIALLFIVAASVQQSGLLKSIVSRMLGREPNGRIALARMVAPVSGLSAFMNNTPIVIMLTPIVRNWCQNHGISPAKLLLPLSYATIFGGMVTLIGTSTNLVVHGLMLDNGLEGFSMFTLAIVGIPGAIIASVYLITIGYKLLPNRRGIEESLYAHSRDYLVEMRVEADCPLIGSSIKQANLRNLSGLYLFEINRNNQRIMPVSSEETIRMGDRLIFTGMVDTIVELQNIKGLSLETGTDIKLEDLRNSKNQIVEAVVSHHSTLLNKSIKESQFRRKFGAAIISVHRKGERIRSKIGDIVLRPGDILLLIADNDFSARHRQSDDFYFINVPAQPQVSDPRKSMLSMLIILCMILLATFNILSMFKAAILAVVALIIFRCISMEEIKRSIHFNVLLLIASAFGIGVALEKTGAAHLVSKAMVEWGEVLGIIGVFAVIYMITNVATEFLSNSAVVAIMFPIALSVAQLSEVEPIAIMVIIAIAASAGFSTPIGYQTNLIVFGPGGYRFVDYIKVGLPLNIIYMIVTISIVSWVWG